MLVVHLEAALQQDAAGAASAAEAILSHMEAALRRHFDNNPGSPEQLVVVLDSRGASTLQVRQPRGCKFGGSNRECKTQGITSASVGERAASNRGQSVLLGIIVPWHLHMACQA